MEKMNTKKNPIPIFKLALFSAINIMWAIGCSAAASPWVQKATDINLNILNQNTIFASKYEAKASIRSYEVPFITHLDTALCRHKL